MVPRAQIVTFILDAFEKESRCNITEDTVAQQNSLWLRSDIKACLLQGAKLRVLSQYTTRTVGDSPFSGNDSIYVRNESTIANHKRHEQEWIRWSESIIK